MITINGGFMNSLYLVKKLFHTVNDQEISGLEKCFEHVCPPLNITILVVKMFNVYHVCATVWSCFMGITLGTSYLEVYLYDTL